MSGRTGRRLWELSVVREVFGKVPGDVREGFELGMGDRSKHDLVTMLLDENFGTGEPEGLWQSHRLTSTVLKDLCSFHSYVI